MSWALFHTNAEKSAAAAELALRQGDPDLGRLLYGQAAEAEYLAFKALEPHKLRTLGITAVSAAALWYKAANFKAAEQVVYEGLAIRQLPEFARAQLSDLLQASWSEAERQRAGVRFAATQVIVSVRGGEVVRGGAPLDLIVDKVQNVQSIYFRTAEFLKGTPHRKHGPPSEIIRKICRPWLFQAPPGSYQFSVAVEMSEQLELFDGGDISPLDVANKFLEIVRATISDPIDELATVVPDKDYRQTFVKLTRNLAPTGKSYETLEIRSLDQASPIRLSKTSREQLSDVIRKDRPKSDRPDQVDVVLTGTLRAVHLDDDWLEVDLGDGRRCRIDQVSDAVDDIIGPLINRSVIVRANQVKDRYRFLDIESDE